MTSEEPRRISLSDPKAMRAMAHPVRMALLELLRLNETLTATEASEALGESPANCAFHLRTLAKYGFVEEAGGGRGRERPWRRMSAGINVSPEDLDDPRAKMAGETLGRALEQRWLERAGRSMAASHTMDGPWRGVAHASSRIEYLTPEELSEVVDELLTVLDRFRDRPRPKHRPEGSMPVELLLFGYPIAEYATASDQA